MKNLIAFISSFIFGMGLEISQMTNPQKVQGFLNIFGEWDPSLAFVMVSAIGINGILYFLLKNKRPLFADRFDLPQKNEIDRSLLIGSFLFGLGWAISGFCPGPAIAGIFRLHWEQAIVILAMVGGFKLAPLIGPKTR